MERCRVLVADRNQRFLEKTVEILGGAGLQTTILRSGSRVVPLCRQERPDVVLLNVDLPSLPGTEICQRLKTVDPLLPVVLMFSKETERCETLATHFQADNFLIRPLKRTELLYCVRGALRLRKLLKERAAVPPSLQVMPPLPAVTPPPGPPAGMVSADIFQAFLSLELRRADRYGFPLSLLSVAVDPLPEDVGAWSNALETQLGPALASAIRSSLRDIDLCCAIGNRELLVLMPHTDRLGASQVAHRVCRRVAAQSYHFGRSRIQPTVSIGITCVHGTPTTEGELLARVKACRLQAASRGGNQLFAG